MKHFKLLILSLFLPFVLSANNGIIDIDEIAKKEAKVENKHILIFFHMTYCPYCKKLIKNSFTHEEAKKKMEKSYIFIDANVDDEGKIKYKDFLGTKKELAKNLAIGFYPTIVFIDENNEIAYAMKGYRKTETFNQILDYITTKSYLEMDFAGYLFEIE